MNDIRLLKLLKVMKKVRIRNLEYPNDKEPYHFFNKRIARRHLCVKMKSTRKYLNDTLKCDFIKLFYVI